MDSYIPQYMIDMENIKETPKTYMPKFFSREDYLRNIHNMDNMTNDNRIKFLKDGALKMLSNDINTYGMNSFTDVINSKKFLYSVGMIINNDGVVAIDLFIKITLCTIYYDYLLRKEIDDASVDVECFMLIEAICYELNRDKIDKLYELTDINPNILAAIISSYYTSIDKNTAIKNLLYYLYTQKYVYLEDQDIVYIIEELFSRIRDLFMVIMFETKNSFNHKSTSDIEFFDKFDRVSIVILLMVNSMTLNDITSLIRMYVNEWEYRKHPIVRFSLQNLPYEYNRIINVVSTLQKEGVFVP